MADQIITTTFKFHLLDSNFGIWRFKDLNKGDSLIILKELDLPFGAQADSYVVGRTAVVTAAAVTITVAVTTTVDLTAEDYTNYLKIYDQAKEEFEKTGKIKGFEVLNLRTLNKLWASHYDMNNLTKFA